jgi:Tfp pilus assembly protein PilX
MKRIRLKGYASGGQARQRGITLVTALIMLVLLTLMAVTAFHIGSSQTIIVSNAQHRDEAMDAAQQAIDKVIHSPDFMDTPTSAISSTATNCSGGTANTWCVDVNGDGTSDIKVALTPAPKCINGAAISNDELNIVTRPDDQQCLTPQSQECLGMPDGCPSTSLCANATWEINAVASDTTTNTSVSVAQGVSTRMWKTSLDTNCK